MAHAPVCFCRFRCPDAGHDHNHHVFVSHIWMTGGTALLIVFISFFTFSGFALLGFLSPANRGSLMTAMVVLLVVMGCA